MTDFLEFYTEYIFAFTSDQFRLIFNKDDVKQIEENLPYSNEYIRRTTAKIYNYYQQCHF